MSEQPLNLVEANRQGGANEPSRTIAKIEQLKSENGRTNGTRIERFVEGAARLDRGAIERLLAA